MDKEIKHEGYSAGLWQAGQLFQVITVINGHHYTIADTNAPNLRRTNSSINKEAAANTRLMADAPRPDHAQYIAHLAKIMKADNRAIFTAASQASKAVAYLEELVAGPTRPQPVASVTSPTLEAL